MAQGYQIRTNLLYLVDVFLQRVAAAIGNRVNHSYLLID
jgi:hypothetical protein